jgi:hypothetical protein
MDRPAKLYRRSALEAVSCPKRYYELYERPDPAVDSGDAALRGTIFHAVAKVYIRRLASLSLTSDHEELSRAVQATIEVTRTPSHLIDEITDLAFRWGLTFELDLDSYLLAEETQQLEDEHVEWTPDLVYVRPHELEQVDWKTHWVGLEDEVVKDQFQAQVYVWQAAQQWPGFDAYRFTFVFPRLGTTATHVWTADEVQDLEVVVTSRIAVIEQCRVEDHWEAIPGVQCGYCRLACPVKDHASLEPSRITTDDDARALAGELLVMEKSVTMRREVLRKWCERNGPVELGGITWGFKSTQTARYPAVKVVDALLEHEVDSPEFWVSTSNLRKWLKQSAGLRRKHPGLADQLVRLEERTTKQSFRSWKTTA